MSHILPEGGHRTVILALLIAGAVLAAAGIFVNSASVPDASTQNAPDPLSAYERDLEARIESLCTAVSGVDSAKALVTLDRTSEKTASSAETCPAVRGVAVVVTGGDRPDIQRELTELISSSLGVPANRVAVAPAK